MCPARSQDPGHGRGPYAGPQGRLGCVHRRKQPPEPVPFLPQPQNSGGNEQKQIASATLIASEIGKRLGARKPRPAPAGFLAPSPRPVEVFAAAGNTAGLPPCGIFSPREIRRQDGETVRRQSRRGSGRCGSAARRCKRCGNAAEIESHGIDQKPERQESARTGDRCASTLAFFAFRLVTRPLCRYSSFLPFPSGLRALPRRPGHEPEWSESDTFPPTHTAAFAPQRV